MYRHFLLCSLSFLFISNSVLSQKAEDKVSTIKGKDTTASASTKKVSVAEKIKSSKKILGLFTLYQDTATGSVQLYIKKEQIGKEFIYQSFSINGPTELFLNQSMHRANMVFTIKNVYDKLEFSEINTNLYYDKNNPVSKSAKVDKPEAIFFTDKYVAEDSLGYLISADALFISEKLDPVKPDMPSGPGASRSFNLGILNSSKSKYNSIRSFTDNTDVIVDLAYDNSSPVNGGADITDARYVRVRMQHSFMAMPYNNFKPRRDDPRVGYFMQTITDQTSISPTPYKDLIHRWNLQKKDTTAAISEPVEPIVWWVENTTPIEYRQTIVEAGLKWNRAFEKAGFKNVIQMKIMPDTATWDPADIHYNVIRWVSSVKPSYGAIGPSFVNPKTGQILGADITVEWYSGSASPVYDELFNKSAESSINSGFNHYDNCSIANELKAQLLSGLTFMETSGATDAELKEVHKQYLTYLILHEMGHTLGLTHNMKASQMLSPAEVNNKAITQKIGLTGSVMDYPAINVSSDRSKQGDYYTTVPGPYDDWAIGYGYTSFDKDEDAELKKILSRSSEPYLAYGNDGDDMRNPGKAIDPRVNINDLTNDAIAYAEDRFKLVNNTMGNLLIKYSKPNQSYAELRARYGTLNTQRLNMISAVSRYIGGVYVDRSFPEQKSATKPFTPTPIAVQKKAMEVLSKYVFAPDAFNADAPVFAYLQLQRRGFTQPPAGEDYKITTLVLNNQTNGALQHLLHPATLQRITNSRLYGNTYSVTDVLNDLTKAIFDADIAGNVNVYRQNLQTSYTKSLVQLTSDPGTDDIAKAAAHYSLKKIKTKLSTAISINEETKAHRNNLLFIIDNALTVK